MSVETEPTNDLAGVLGDLRTEIASLRDEVKQLRSPHLEILREPLTYAAHLVYDRSGPRSFRAVSNAEPRSYIKDLVLANKRGDRKAEARLDRHAQEMRALAKTREALLAPDARYEFEQRTVNWATGTGGYSAPPLWIIDQFATVPTPERVLSRDAPQFLLPVGAQSVSLPRWTAGAEVGAPQLNVGAVDTDVADSIVSSAVVTLAGTEDVPLQMLEQSPVGAHLDWAVFTNMEARYGFQLEYQMIAGTGATGDATRSGNNELLGILNNTAIPSASVINYTGHSEANADGATSMFPWLGQLISNVGQRRFAHPEMIMLTTSRAAWLGSSEDTQTRPLMITNTNGSGKFDIVFVNAAINDAIPRNVGGTILPVTFAGSQEPIIACRPSDWLVLESDRHVQVMPDVLSGTMEVRLQMRRYAATLLRQPTSVSVMLGAGMVTGGYTPAGQSTALSF